MKTYSHNTLSICVWLIILFTLQMEIVYMQGVLAGLKTIVFWIAVGYFLTDIQIAVAHFEIDNFMPDDNGYKHHLTVAKYGFKYEKLVGQQPLIDHHSTQDLNHCTSATECSGNCSNSMTNTNKDESTVLNSPYSTKFSVEFDLDTLNTEVKDLVQVPCSPCAPCGPCCAPGTPGCSPCCPCSPAKKAVDIYHLFNTINNTIHQTSVSQAKEKKETNYPLQIPCTPCAPCGPCCSPGGPACSPCCPCSPSSKKINFLWPLVRIFDMLAFLIKALQPDISSNDPKSQVDKLPTTLPVSLWSFLICLTPVACSYIGLPIGMSLMLPVFNILNIISGSGSPDYYAHHSEKAPNYVKLAQQLHLMMTPDDHEKHHKNPRTGYAYFSPITNVLLDHSGFWSIVKVAMEWHKGMKAVPVPVPLAD